jgi:outer membrane protein OmpA-like peptidoglycan-associated protein
VEGDTDSGGSEEYNQSLSERRAQAVRDCLVQQGITSNILAWSLGRASRSRPTTPQKGGNRIVA